MQQTKTANTIYKVEQYSTRIDKWIGISSSFLAKSDAIRQRNYCNEKHPSIEFRVLKIETIETVVDEELKEIVDSAN